MKRSNKRRGSFLIIISLFTVLAIFTSANAAPGPIVAGFGNRYLTKPSIMRAGTAVNFVNLDLALHDVQSDAPGLFFSAQIGIGKKTPVFGVQSLPKGSYGFFCSIHPYMRATLKVI